MKKLACVDYLQGKYNGNKNHSQIIQNIVNKTNKKFQIKDVIN